MKGCIPEANLDLEGWQATLFPNLMFHERQLLCIFLAQTALIYFGQK